MKTIELDFVKEIKDKELETLLEDLNQGSPNLTYHLLSYSKDNQDYLADLEGFKLTVPPLKPFNDMVVGVNKFGELVITMTLSRENLSSAIHVHPQLGNNVLKDTGMYRYLQACGNREITSVVTSSLHRSKGYGTYLITKTLANLKSCTVLPVNTWLESKLRNMGMVEINPVEPSTLASTLLLISNKELLDKFKSIQVCSASDYLAQWLSVGQEVYERDLSVAFITGVKDREWLSVDTDKFKGKLPFLAVAYSDDIHESGTVELVNSDTRVTMSLAELIEGTSANTGILTYLAEGEGYLAGELESLGVLEFVDAGGSTRELDRHTYLR